MKDIDNRDVMITNSEWCDQKNDIDVAGCGVLISMVWVFRQCHSYRACHGWVSSSVFNYFWK